MTKFSAAVLSIGMICMGLLVAQGLKQFNRNERVIYVRGLAEKEVESNFAVWKISFLVSSSKLDEVRASFPLKQKIVQNFLTANGFKDDEISKSSSIRDRQAQDYGAEKSDRYVASSTLTVKTNNVKQVEKAVQGVDELLKNGIVMTSNKVEYFFTELNQVKPVMLDEATRNAKEAATGFANSMNVKVGTLKTASQGVFSIENTIDGDYESSSLRKKVRVVTQVEFYID